MWGHCSCVGKRNPDLGMSCKPCKDLGIYLRAWGNIQEFLSEEGHKQACIVEGSFCWFYIDQVIIWMALIKYWWDENKWGNKLWRCTTAFYKQAFHKQAFLSFHCLRQNACWKAVMGWILSPPPLPPHLYIEALRPGTSECESIWR